MPACTIPAKAEGAFAILCPTPSLCSLEAVKGVKVAKVGIRALAQKSVGGLLTPTLSWCLPLVWSFAQRIFSVYGSRRRVERARRLTYILAKILRLLSLLAQIMEDGGRVGSLAPRGLVSAFCRRLFMLLCEFGYWCFSNIVCNSKMRAKIGSNLFLIIHLLCYDLLRLKSNFSCKN